jgi:acyl-CoA thioesterase
MEDVFLANGEGSWTATEYARGPFTGLAGGAVAGLLSAELEACAARWDMGPPLAATVQLLRPAPVAQLRTMVEVVREGERVSVLRAQLLREDVPLAVATLTFAHRTPCREVDEPARSDQQPDDQPYVPLGGGETRAPWFMQTFDTRLSPDGVYWFRSIRPVTSPLTPMAQVLGPADWTHGLRRPQADVAFPNVDLSVHLTRLPEGEWIGVRPETRWSRSGVGRGQGLVLDAQGEIGAVSMSVLLIPANL